MSDTFITIMIILIAAVLVFMVPVVTIAKRNDVTANQEVQATVTEFVDKVRVTGKIDQLDYDNLLQNLEASGNLYEIEITLQQIDENPAKKSSTDISDRIKIGENIYYIEYTTQIEEAFEKSTDGVIRLSEGDYVKVDVKNVNQTLYQNFKKTLYNLSNGQIGTISGIHVGIIINSTEGEQLVESPQDRERYTITYDLNGGNANCPAPQEKIEGIDLTLSKTKPTHANTDLIFVGWSEDPNATEPDYVAGGIFKKDKNTKLYAVWREREYNVIYLANLDKIVEGLPAQDDNLVKYTEYHIWQGRAIPTTTSGYTFKCWNTSADGTGTIYDIGETIIISENLILYAIWSPGTFKVVYNKNTSDYTFDRQGLPEVEVQTYDVPFKIPSNIPTREKYKFLGWSTTKNGEVEYKPGDDCLLTPYEEVKNLYAVWGEKITLKYNSNIKVLVVGYNNSEWVNSAVEYLNNSGQFMTDGISVEQGNLEAVVDKKDEYDLIIINASAWSLGTLDSNSGDLVKEIANATHLITFGNDERGIPLINQSTATYMANVNVEIASNEKGSELIGENIATQYDSALYSVNFNSDVTVLYTAKYIDASTGQEKGQGDAIGIAQWKKGNNWVHGQIKTISYPLLYRLAMIAINGPEKTENLVSNMPNPDEEIRGNTEIFNLSSSIPTRSNSVFKGWSEDSNGEVQYQAGQEYTMPNKDVTLYAVWGAKLEYSGNIKALIVGYTESNRSWMEGVADYLEQTGQFVTEKMLIGAGQLDKVVDRKDEFDVIVLNTSMWAPSSIQTNATNKLTNIATSTNLITFGNDETAIPFIQKSQVLKNVDMKISATTQGQELIGENIETQIDDSLTSITFKTDVDVLYVAKYESRTNAGEVLGTGDAIGFYEWNDKNNWIHGQINNVSNELTYKLIKVVLNGLEKTEKVVKNLPESQVYTLSSTVKISDAIPTRKGHEFLGWAETSNGEIKYAPGEQILIPRANMKLYAIWQADYFTITYDANGGEGAPDTQIYEYDPNSYTKLSDKIPTRVGYDFLGWSLSKTATTPEYYAGQQWSQGIARNTKLYAVWAPSVYTITLDSQGATTQGTTEVYEKYTVGIYLDSNCTNMMTNDTNPITIPEKTGGYIFGGYYTEKEGVGTQLINGKGYITSEFKNTYFTTDTTLYALWFDAVARIDTIYYKTLQEAFDAVPTNGQSTTVYLLADTQENTQVLSGQNIILQLDGNTVSSASGATITNNGTLKIIEGTVQSGGVVSTDATEDLYANTGYIGVAVANYNSLEINGGNFKGARAAVSNFGSGAVVINGGEFSSETKATISNYYNGNIIVAGGTISCSDNNRNI